MSSYCKVLVVDDEFITRQGIKHMILWEQEGFQIVGEASNGQEALEMIEKYQPDIVLADIVMPVMNGIDFSLIIQEKYPHIKLIVLSSYDDFEYVRSTLLNGAVDYVLKPTLNPEILLRALKKAVSSIPGFHLDHQEQISAKIQLERYLTGYQDELDEDGLEQEILCYVINYKKKQEEALLSCILESAKRAGNIEKKLLYVLSRSFGDLNCARDIYEKGVKPCLRQKFYFHERYLISEDEYVPFEGKRFRYEEYTKLLKEKQYSQALRLLQEYIEYLAENQYDEYLSKNLLKNLLYNFLMEIESSTEEDPRIAGIKEYISLHYKEKLDLTDIAREFSFNYHYISSYFNQHISEGFSGYLNTIRIKKSCELLRETQMPISDVSVAVGYSDHGYYCRIFRKIMGQTPSQYRHKAKEGEK